MSLSTQSSQGSHTPSSEECLEEYLRSQKTGVMYDHNYYFYPDDLSFFQHKSCALCLSLMGPTDFSLLLNCPAKHTVHSECQLDVFPPNTRTCGICNSYLVRSKSTGKFDYNPGVSEEVKLNFEDLCKIFKERLGEKVSSVHIDDKLVGDSLSTLILQNKVLLINFNHPAIVALNASLDSAVASLVPEMIYYATLLSKGDDVSSGSGGSHANVDLQELGYKLLDFLSASFGANV